MHMTGKYQRRCRSKVRTGGAVIACVFNTEEETRFAEYAKKAVLRSQYDAKAIIYDYARRPTLNEDIPPKSYLGTE